jgi:hypothetical protein
MSILYSYPTSQPTVNDLLIGTDINDDNATKTFTVQSLVSLINAAAGTGTVTDITIFTDTFLEATKTSAPGAAAITYTIGLAATGTPSANNFLRGDNQWVTPTVSAGISVFNQTTTLITNDVQGFNFNGAGVTTTAGGGGTVNVTIPTQISDVNSVSGLQGITVTPLSGRGNVVVTNTGVTQLTTGTGLSVDQTTGNIVLSLTGATGGGSVTSVSAGPGLRVQSGVTTVNPTLAVQYVGAQNVIAQGISNAVPVAGDQILFNQATSTDVKSTALSDIPLSALTSVQTTITADNVGNVRNDTDTFTTALASNIITLEQGEYDALATTDPNTLYFTTATAVTPTTTTLAIDVSNITNNTGVAALPITFGGDQPGLVKTGQPGATVTPQYNSTIIIDPSLYQWNGGAAPTVTNATGVFPATGNTTLTSTASAAILELLQVVQNTSTLNAAFTRTFTLDGVAWASPPAGVITTTYTGSPAALVQITGDTGTNYDQATEFAVDFTKPSAQPYVMSNKTITYNPVQGNYNGGTTTVTLTADFVSATASGTPEVFIEDLINSNAGADRTVEYPMNVWPNPQTGNPAIPYTVPVTQTGQNIVIPITHAPFLTVGTTTRFEIGANIGSGGPFFPYQFQNTAGIPASQFNPGAAVVSVGPGNTGSAVTQTTGGGRIDLTIAATGTNRASFKTEGQIELKNGTSAITGFNSNWASIAPSTAWVGQLRVDLQYRITAPGGAAGSYISLATPTSTGGVYNATAAGPFATPPVIVLPTISVPLNSTIEWRALLVINTGMTVSNPFVVTSVSSAGGSDSGSQTAVNNLGNSTSVNNSAGDMSFATPILATHLINTANPNQTSAMTVAASGSFIQNLQAIANGITSGATSATNACCTGLMQDTFFYDPGSANASLNGIVAYQDALKSAFLPPNFYRVLIGGVPSFIQVNTLGRVQSNARTCPACATPATRIAIRLVRQGSLVNGTYSTQAQADRAASYGGYQKNTLNQDGLGALNLQTVFMQKGATNTNLTTLEVGDGLFLNSDINDPTSVIGNNSFMASMGVPTIPNAPLAQNSAFRTSGTAAAEFGVNTVSVLVAATLPMFELARSINGSGNAGVACGLELDPPLFILKNGANTDTAAVQNFDFAFGNITRTLLLTGARHFRVTARNSPGAGGTATIGTFFTSGNVNVTAAFVNQCNPCS